MTNKCLRVQSRWSQSYLMCNLHNERSQQWISNTLVSLLYTDKLLLAYILVFSHLYCCPPLPSIFQFISFYKSVLSFNVAKIVENETFSFLHTFWYSSDSFAKYFLYSMLMCSIHIICCFMVLINYLTAPESKYKTI